MVHGSTPFSEDSESAALKPPSSGTRNSYGYWTGSRSSLSTPNLGGSLHQTGYDLHNSGSIHGRDPFGPGPTPSSFPSTTSDTHGGNTQSLTQAQVSSVGSMASVDSASSASFQHHRKRSESTGGFKSTAGNISRIVRKSSSNFLKKLVKNFDDKDAPPIPTSQYSMSSISLVSQPGDHHGSHSSLVPEMPMLRSLSSQNVRIGPLDTPPPLSPLMGDEMAYQFAAPMSLQDTVHHSIGAEVHPSSWPNSSTSMVSGSQYMTTVLSPQEVADSLAQLVSEAALVTEDRDTELDEEEEEEEEDGDEDEDEDEDVPAAITNRLSRLYDTGSIHLNQSQTSLYYSTKSTLSDSEASEMMESMSTSSSPCAVRVSSDDININANTSSTSSTSKKGSSSSRRASYVQDALGYSLGLSRGNSIRFSQYNLGTMQGFSGAPVQPLSSSTSTPTSPGTVRGTSSTTAANNREFGEARKSATRRPVTMFIPLTSSATDHSESDVDTLTAAGDTTYDAAPALVHSTGEPEVSSPPTSPFRERLQERVMQPLTVDTASLPPTDTIDSSPILPPSFGRSLTIQSTAPKRPMTVCVDTNQALAPLYPLATPTLLTPDDPQIGEQRESASLLAQRTARRCFDEDESFLRREDISEYLGTPKPFHRQVLEAYMNHFDFRGKRIDMAFRLLCQKLILKGETQEVDRILEAFARRYVDCNDGRYQEGNGRSRPMLLAVADHAKDVVHAVSYSILLLNTDLHVVQQSTKMSRSAFVKNTLEVVQAQRGGSSTPGMGSPVHTVDPAGLGMPRSLTSDSISEAGLAPSTNSSFPSMGRRRTPSVKSWKSGHSQQSTSYDLGGSSNVIHNTGSSNSRMGSDPTANGGYGNGKAWIQELESLFKDIYTAVKHSQIRLPSPTSAIQTPVSGPHSSRGGSRSNSTFSAISSPPASPAMAPVGGFGSSLFSSNRMSRLIQPSTLFTSNQTHPQQPPGGELDYPTDSGVGLFGGSVNRRKSMSTRATQLRSDAIQRLSAQAQAQAQANAQAMANAMAVAQAQAEADAELRERNSSARLAVAASAPSPSVAAPPSRSRYSVFGNLDVSFGGGGGGGGGSGNGNGNGNGSTFVDRGPVSSRDVVYQQQSLPGSSRRHSNFILTEHGTNTSVSAETTPSASQNSLASLQSSTLSMSAGGPRDEPRSKPSSIDHSTMEHKIEDSVASVPTPSQEVSSFLDEFTAEQKELRHQLHLQSRYRMEGILWRKHLLERSDKKAQHRAWRQLLVVLDMEQGSLAMFRSDGTLPAMSRSALPSPSSNPPPSSGSNRHHPSGHRTNPTTPTSMTPMAHMALFDEIPLQHTITNILPPPGYSSTRRNVFAVQLFTGGVYLFQTSTPQECENWARSCNYWAARTSKEPLAGGVINMEYGWGRALETYVSRSPLSPSASLSPLVTLPQHELGLSPISHSALASPFAQSPGAMSSASASSPVHYLNQPAGSDASGYFGISSGNAPVGNSGSSPLQVRSSGRSTSMKSSSSRRGSISLSSFGAMTGGVGSTSAHMLSAGGASTPPGDQVTLFEWTAPQPAMALSPHTEEADQLWALKKYVSELESEMEAHQEHRGPMLKLFPPKSVNHVKAFNNWERRSRHLLKEMVKNKIYEECLGMSISYQNEQDLQELKAWQTLRQPPPPPPLHLQEGRPLAPRKEQHQQLHQHPMLHHQPSMLLPGIMMMTSGTSDVEADLEALVVHDEPDF